MTCGHLPGLNKKVKNKKGDMFSKLNSVKRFGPEIITIDQLVQLVRDNPNKDLINQIRISPYKSTIYNNLKLKLACISPHGTFTALKNENLISLSKYLYYDIDGLNEDELIDTKNKLIDTNFICFICKSVGGRGLSFLIRINDTENELNDTNFLQVWGSTRQLLINMGFIIDSNASGLCRKMIISYDDNVFYKEEVSLSYKKGSSLIRKSNNVKISGKKKGGCTITPTDTFLVIPIKRLLDEIKTTITYDKPINGDWVIEDKETYTLLLPKVIKDGDKRKTYRRVINALYYINENITRNQIYSYIWWLNSIAQPPMSEWNLKKFVSYIIAKIETTGEVAIKTRIKKIHFNKMSKLTKRQKQSIGAKLAGKIKNKKSIDSIRKTIDDLVKQNIIPTQKKVAEATGLSLATIKRNWRKTDVDFSDIKCEDKIDDVMTEDEFWNNWQPDRKAVIDDYLDKDFGDGDEIPGIIESGEL